MGLLPLTTGGGTGRGAARGAGHGRALLRPRALAWLRGGVQVAVAAGFFFPLYWVLVTATGQRGQAYQLPPVLVPHLDFHPLLTVVSAAPWLRYFANTIGMTLATVLWVVGTSALAGYALAEGRFRGREAVLLALLGAAMVPEQALLVPRYLVVHSLHLLNTYVAEVLPLLLNGFGVLLYRQFFLTLPSSYRDAARLEGCGEFGYLRHVALPLGRGITYAVALLAAIAAWNQFQWPLIVTSSRALQPLEVVLAHFSQAYQSDWRRMASAILLAAGPLVLFFAFVRRQIMAAVTGDVDSGLAG